jgi:ABC-type polysaccharide/polyol phosphate transport system ATPase subunit
LILLERRIGFQNNYDRARECQNESSQISVDGLIKKEDNVIALAGIAFDVRLNQTLAIVGPNGAGKSTLLSIMAGCRTVTSGKIKFQGSDLTIDLKNAP